MSTLLILVFFASKFVNDLSIVPIFVCSFMRRRKLVQQQGMFVSERFIQLGEKYLFEIIAVLTQRFFIERIKMVRGFHQDRDDQIVPTLRRCDAPGVVVVDEMVDDLFFFVR